MTVIVYRDGIMAADSGGWQYDMLVARTISKIVVTKEGGLAAFCGRRGHIIKGQNWLQGCGDKPPPAEKEDLFGLLVHPDGSVLRCDNDFEFYPAEEAPFYVCGADGAFLIGALAAGASAPHAVELAIEFCDGAAGKVTWKRLQPQNGKTGSAPPDDPASVA